jgi:hypothetical protein
MLRSPRFRAIAVTILVLVPAAVTLAYIPPGGWRFGGNG